MKEFFLLGVSLLLTLSYGCSDQPKTESQKSHEQVEAEVYYTCPMHPSIKEDGPGKCPICHMNLSRVEKESHDHDEHLSYEQNNDQDQWYCENYPEVKSSVEGPCPIDGTPMKIISQTRKMKNVVANVRLNASRRSHFHAEVFQVTPMKMNKKIQLLGQVLQSEERESNITARIEGRVEKVYVDSSGVFIKKNDPVVDIYSPKLITAGEEYLLARRGFESQGAVEYKALLDQAQKRLEQWGVRAFQLEEWNKSNEVPRLITLYSPESGIVRQRNAVSGRYFKEGESFFDLVDLTSVWVEMDVYESDSSLVGLGQKIELKFSALHGKVWAGEIDFVSPVISPESRTLKVRATLDNTDGLLRPGMVADGQLFVEKEGEPLVIPRTAIIDTGNRKVVWLEHRKNSYQAKAIETGFQSEGYTEVVSGLSQNDRVVIEGHFLLDAQAQLFGGYEDEEKASAHQH